MESISMAMEDIARLSSVSALLELTADEMMNAIATKLIDHPENGIPPGPWRIIGDPGSELYIDLYATIGELDDMPTLIIPTGE